MPGELARLGSVSPGELASSVSAGRLLSPSWAPDSPALHVRVGGLGVINTVQYGHIRSEAAPGRRVRQHGNERQFGVLRRLHPPRDRQAGDGADGGVDLVTVNPPPLRVETDER